MSTAMGYEQRTCQPAPARLDDATIGAIIRTARTRQGLTLRDVARYLGCTHPAVAHWESGLNRPPLMMRIRLARLLNMPFSELVPEAERQVTVSDPQAIALLQAFEQVPVERRDMLVDIVAGAAEKIAKRTA
jgi:transcriptional regulator with XRE-family HTH domain